MINVKFVVRVKFRLKNDLLGRSSFGSLVEVVRTLLQACHLEVTPQVDDQPLQLQSFLGLELEEVLISLLRLGVRGLPALAVHFLEELANAHSHREVFSLAFCSAG